MKNEMKFVFVDRTIDVSDCSLGHYEDALTKWRFAKSIWGIVWCLLFGSGCRQVEYTHGQNHACIDLGQVIAIQLRQVY